MVSVKIVTKEYISDVIKNGGIGATLWQDNKDTILIAREWLEDKDAIDHLLSEIDRDYAYGIVLTEWLNRQKMYYLENVNSAPEYARRDYEPAIKVAKKIEERARRWIDTGKEKMKLKMEEIPQEKKVKILGNYLYAHIDRYGLLRSTAEVGTHTDDGEPIGGYIIRYTHYDGYGTEGYGEAHTYIYIDTLLPDDIAEILAWGILPALSWAIRSEDDIPYDMHVVGIGHFARMVVEFQPRFWEWVEESADGEKYQGRD